MSIEPPRLALGLLRLALPPQRYETISGDLEEIFNLKRQLLGARGARRWFWRQTFSIVSTRPLAAGALLDAPRSGDRMQAIRYDVRYAFRALLKTPGFTAIAVLTLAFGIGGSTAIFTLVQGLLLKPLPFRDPEQLMIAHISLPESLVNRGFSREMPWSYPEYRQLFIPNQHAFQDSALFQGASWTLTSNGGDPEALRGELIDSRYLTVLGITPQLGRDIRADEDRSPGVAPIVLLSHALWQRRFGGDPSAIGQSIGLNTTPHTIVGILPADFRGLSGEARSSCRSSPPRIRCCAI
jgi:hypothetical protein